MNLKTSFSILLFLSLFTSCSTHLTKRSSCIVTKAAFDIGSGTTKMKVAKVDTCKQRISEMLLESSVKVGYKKSLQTSNDNTFKNKIIEQGVEALKSLKEKAAKFNPISYEGVATSAFRTASNGIHSAKEISKRSGVNVKVITQDEEATIGFDAATTGKGRSKYDYIVWDIGGGSMQITSLDKSDNFTIYKGNVASVTFKDYIISDLYKKDITKVKSPNPIPLKTLLRSRVHARITAQMNIARSLKGRIKNGTKVVAIGGLHYYSIRGQLPKRRNFYTLSEVDNAISRRAGMTDKQINNKYSATDISNLALVAGFMDGLGLKRVDVDKINLADGVLIRQEN